jgi:hypothetical protein
VFDVSVQGCLPGVVEGVFEAEREVQGGNIATDGEGDGPLLFAFSEHYWSSCVPLRGVFVSFLEALDGHLLLDDFHLSYR